MRWPPLLRYLLKRTIKQLSLSRLALLQRLLHISMIAVLTQKLLARCFFVVPTYDGANIQAQVFAISRALFERAHSERELLVRSFPVVSMRLSKSNVTAIQIAAAQRLVWSAECGSRANTVVCCILQIIALQCNKV
jgi:hypothetical protein